MSLFELFKSQYFYVLAILALAYTLVVLTIPSIIHTANRYKLYDTADLHRKSHRFSISRLGGIAIFCSFTITTLLFATTVNYQNANFLITSCIILFALGLKDDIYGVNPRTKFALQIVVASILVLLGDFRLTSLYGVFNVDDVNPIFGACFSIALIVFINNAFNLIDGIDGLAGTIGVVVNLAFGILFLMADELPYAFIAFSLVGAILGFLKYNFTPAKIFMGDTGSLIIGLVSATLAIKFIELNKFGLPENPYFYSAPSIAVAILIVPIFDSLRIFFIRVLDNKSPFLGDNNHIHHRLRKLGLSTYQIVILLSMFNVLMIAFALFLQHLGNFTLIFLMIGVCVVFNTILTYIKGKKREKSYTLSDVLIRDTFKIQKTA